MTAEGLLKGIFKRSISSFCLIIINTMEPAKCEKHKNTQIEDWDAYMAAKKRKLKEQFEEDKSTELSFTEERSNIFEGVSIFVNGYTDPPLEELRRLMMRHGGTLHHYYSRKNTTHIIATNLPYSKIKQLKGEKVVRPEWITDSVKVGKLLPDYNYLLYSVSSKGQKTIDFAPKAAIQMESTSEQVSENYHIPSKVQKTESSHSSMGCEAEENLLPDEVCNKDIVISAEESAKEPENCVNSALNQCEEDNSESLKGIQRILNNSESKAHKQCSNVPNFNAGHSSSIKAGASNFISEFYNHSRLHHISTAKSNFQTYVTELRNCKHFSFAGREKLKELYQNDPSSQSGSIENRKSHSAKIFMHIDMDCFFASVSLLKYPGLKGQPVAVTHSKTGKCQRLPGSDREYELQYYKRRYLNNGKEQLGNDLKEMDIDSEDYYGSSSEIASCNYHARRFGVHNGMFVGEAKKLCPELHMVPYDFEGYERISKLLYDIVASYTLDIQAVSCDEMYIDCSSVLAETSVSPLQLAGALRKEIEEKTGCTASAGLGSNLLLAQLATKTAKPNGQYYVEPQFSEEFIKQQLVSDLPGVGSVLESRLKAMNVVTCEDLQNVSIGKLQNEFGAKTGKMLFEYCRGIDFREIKTDNKRKSVSAEINYGMRFQKLHEVKSFLKELAEEVQTRLQKINMRGKSVTLKLKTRKVGAPVEPSKYMGHGICDNITKTMQLGSSTNNSIAIARACVVLLQNQKIKPEDIRGIGIQVSHLEQISTKDNSRNQILLNFVQKADKSHSTGGGQCSFSPPRHRPEEVKSFSEVDPEVFAALPEELKNEIIEFYNGSKSTITKEAIDQQICFPTTAHASANNSNFSGSSAERNPVFDLPSFSQLDQDVLTALPDEVRDEIMEAYNNRMKTNEYTSPQKQQRSANALMLLLEPSPSKTRSPKSKQSPVSKSSKGNKCNNNSVKQSPVRPSINTNSTFSRNEEKKNDGDNRSTEEPFEEPNLCGAVTVDEVKALLAEWVSSSNAPEEEDIALFSQYIVDVTMEKNLEKLNRIIKCFYRLVKKAGSICWQESYLDLVTVMQSTMLQIYGSTLKIETDF